MSNVKTFLKVLSKVGYPNPDIQSIARMIDYNIEEFLPDLVAEIGEEKADDFTEKALNKMSTKDGIRIQDEDDPEQYAYIKLHNPRLDLDNDETTVLCDWSWAKLKEDMKFKFKLDNPKLRHATSQVSSNSWVKAKKKLLVADEYNIGVKSLFHAIRIPMFSTQLVELGMIKDFKCANHIWDKIKEKHWTWEELHKEFRSEHNLVLTEFRKLVGKE